MYMPTCEKPAFKFKNKSSVHKAASRRRSPFSKASWKSMKIEFASFPKDLRLKALIVFFWGGCGRGGEGMAWLCVYICVYY